MVSVHFTTLCVTCPIMRTSCFDTHFASQMKLTNLPLIHCFEFYLGLRIEDGVSELQDLFHAFWRSVKGGPYSSGIVSLWRGAIDTNNQENKDTPSVMANTVLLLSPLREASGNKSTALRIGSHFTQPHYKCIVKSPQDFKDKSDFEAFLEQNNVDVTIAIHAVHCANLLSDCRTPYVLIFGGTDVNCSDQFCDRFKTVTDVVINARFNVCFSNSMYEKAVSLWPDIPAEKLEIIPQGIIDCRPLPTCASGVKVFETQTNNAIMKMVSALLGGDIPHKCHELPKDVKFFTLVAGIRRVKDPMYLLDAFSEWHSTNKNIYLIIVGPILDEELGKSITLKVKKLPGVFYHGSQSLPVTHCIIEHSTALLNSSISEGMSLAILEAMTLGVPVVARDIPGNRSLIEHGKTGFLFSSPQECVEYCKQIVENKELVNDLVTNGKRKVQERHSCDAECLAYIDIVQKILAER